MKSNQSANSSAAQADQAYQTDAEQQRWVDRLHRLGLAGIAGAVLDASAPLAPLIGQLLYIAQPTLGLFIARRSVGVWAEWLDQPDNLRAFADSLNRPLE